MKAHTPGPWEAEHRHVHGGPEDDEMGGLGWDVTGPPEPGMRGRFALAADAHLTAAAPDLLEACRWFVTQLDDHVLVRDISRDGNPDWPMRMLRFTAQLSKAVAAIEKAEPTPDISHEQPSVESGPEDAA